jgi:hypothetical protein
MYAKMAAAYVSICLPSINPSGRASSSILPSTPTNKNGEQVCVGISRRAGVDLLCQPYWGGIVLEIQPRITEEELGESTREAGGFRSFCGEVEGV